MVGRGSLATASDRAHTVGTPEQGAQRSGGPDYGSEGWGFESLRAHDLRKRNLALNAQRSESYEKEVRDFRLSPAWNMGVKRDSGRGSFCRERDHNDEGVLQRGLTESAVESGAS